MLIMCVSCKRRLQPLHIAAIILLIISIHLERPRTELRAAQDLSILVPAAPVGPRVRGQDAHAAIPVDLGSNQGRGHGQGHDDSIITRGLQVGGGWRRLAGPKECGLLQGWSIICVVWVVGVDGCPCVARETHVKPIGVLGVDMGHLVPALGLAPAAKAFSVYGGVRLLVCAQGSHDVQIMRRAVEKVSRSKIRFKHVFVVVVAVRRAVVAMGQVVMCISPVIWGLACKG